MGTTAAPEEGQADYDPSAVVAAFATYRDHVHEPRRRLWRRPRRPSTHPYTGDWNFRVHSAVLEAHMPAEGTILEAGPGGGANYTKLLARGRRRVIAGDISPAQLRDLREALAGHPAEARTTTMELDITALPLDDGSIDGVACIGGVLSYVLDAAPRALAEIHRVLRPGGRAVISVMTPGWITSPSLGYREIMSAERFAAMAASGDVTGPELDPTDHRYRCYTAARLTALLQAAGFRVLDRLASHLDAVPPGIPLADYLAACRAERALDSTRGYLIAVAERSGDR